VSANACFDELSTGLEEKLAKLESEMQRLAAMEKLMLASPDQQISLTDPRVGRQGHHEARRQDGGELARPQTGAFLPKADGTYSIRDAIFAH
jgi:hypothetical protein